ncbi:YheC/YheD family protein [Neobacillus niacini]|uniref:YheC/YheD family endospore coat-associated protein n=1 Tax=Neobacillus niacini TaxID=86668 RepID=UPI0021CB5068|nr:YheC/YheD family protein [Neobacillus niacini]MCM3767346.1 YheC/YheD family protein [Neobacillus niacini]
MNSSLPHPVIGIMAARRSDGTITGNSELFIKLQKKLISLNGISFVFTYENAGKDMIDGYIFDPDQSRWMKERFPYPDVVYNRIPFRKTEQQDESQRFFSLLKEKNIPFFNPCFIDKFELYQLLKKHPFLKKYLPESLLVTEDDELHSFLTGYKSIYLKPAHSSKGKGIFRLRIDSDNRLTLQDKNTSQTYPSFQHFWEEWRELLLKKNYLAQQEIESSQFDGFRYDFRILAHADKEKYKVTGIAIRQSQEQDITTHIPSGGRMLPYERVQTSAHDHFIHSIVSPIGTALSEQFGYFGEFSIDAAVSTTGHYYIFEVNSKPMSFNEPEIEARKIEQLCQLFLRLAKKPI